jgi:hypothetical protein
VIDYRGLRVSRASRQVSRGRRAKCRARILRGRRATALIFLISFSPRFFPNLMRDRPPSGATLGLIL